MNELEYAEEYAKDTAQFQRHYAETIESILAMPSGRHSVDPDRLEQWIQAQQTVERRDVARKLANCIRYITHADVIRLCDELIDKVYADIPLEQPVAWIVGTPQKSNYMISLLCYHALQQKGYPEPLGFIQVPYGFDDTTLYIGFDDMTYSGSQLSKLLVKIAEHSILKSRQLQFPTIRYCLLSASEQALQYLKTLELFDMFANLKDNTFQKKIQQMLQIANENPSLQLKNRMKLPNPFPIYAGQIIPSLKSELGEKDYYRAVLAFNGYTADTIVYFDHKIADSVSTFMKVLLYGVVMPQTYKFKDIDEFHEQSWDILTIIKNKCNCKEILNETPVSSNADKEHLQFIPFLRNCPSRSNDRWIHELSGEKSIYFLNNYSYVMTEDDRFQLIQPPLKDWDDITLRCPFSWYKSYFRGGRKSRRKSRNRRTRKQKRYRNLIHPH